MCGPPPITAPLEERRGAVERILGAERASLFFDAEARPVMEVDPGATLTVDTLDCAAGIFGRLVGADMMPVLLNAADRPLFLGSRPTPFDGADGYPALLDPLI